MNGACPKRLVILGPPGVGKGTQGKLLSESLGLSHIASGDLVRHHQAKETRLGKLSQSYYSMGLLVPDVYTIQIVMPEVLNASSGFILDGFPRNIFQAERLDSDLGAAHLELDRTLLITAPQEEIMRRLAGRRVCPVCKLVYQMNSQPPAISDLCDSCQAPLIQRKDDTPQAIKKRMEEYHAQTLPLAEYYRSQNKLMEVSGSGNVRTVLHRILQRLQGPRSETTFANSPPAGQTNPGLSFKKRPV